MKNQLKDFPIRYLLVLLLGLFLLLLRSMAHDPVSAVFLPQFASPWELSKLAYWPLLAAMVATARGDGGVKACLARRAVWLTVAPVTAFLVFWAISALEPGAGAYLLVLVVLSAAALLLPAQTGGKEQGLWLVLLVALGAAYILLTFLPPMWGPFLDPSDVSAMARIPY